MNAYSITEYGAVDNAEVTDAFEGAVEACADGGGGTVYVPAGDYETGTVELCDDITLSLAPGARVYASSNEANYDSESEYVGPDGERPVFVAKGRENVTVTGDGVVDGHGTEIMEMDEPIRGHSGQSTAFPLVSDAEPAPRQGETFLDPSEGTEEWPVAKPAFRPGPTFVFDGCSDIAVRDITLRDMPSWTLAIRDCEGVVVTGIKVENHMRIPNCDGLSIEGSRNVRVSDCSIRCCDDAVSLLTRSSESICENVTVTNCTFVSRACAVKIGSETAGPIRNVRIQNCVVHGSNRGLGIQHRDGGDVTDVAFSDIVVETHLFEGPWWGKAEPIYVTSVPRDEETDLGTVRDVRLSNVSARCENGAVVYGHADASIENVQFNGVELRVRDSPAADIVGGNIDLQPTSVRPPIEAHDAPAVHCENVVGLHLVDVAVEWGEDLPAYYTHGVACVGVEDLTINGFDGSPAHLDASAAAISVQNSSTLTVRDSRARPETKTFLSVTDTTDGRLFTGNDITDAERGIDGDADFTVVGNVGLH